MAYLMASSGSWVPVVIFLVIIAFKVLSAIVKAAKDATQDSGKPAGSDGQDMWQPRATPQATKRSAPPPVPPTAKARRSAPPPVPTASLAGKFNEVTLPEGISEEAAQAIHTLESADDKFERRQDQAYDLEVSDRLMDSEDAFSLTRKPRSSKTKHVRVSFSGKRLRDAVITREVLAPPRCFDI